MTRLHQNKQNTWLHGKRVHKTNSFNMKRSISIVAACFLVFLEFGCDFQNPSDFKTPTWNVNLTLPLIDTFYPLSDIASNDSSKTSDGESMANIIKSAGDSLLIDFEGELTETTISRDYLIVPETNPDAVSQSINVPTVSDILTVPLSYDSSFGFSADLPSSIPVPGVTGGDVWKSQVLAVLEPNVNDAFPQKIASIPLNNAFNSIDFASVDGITIKGVEDDNYFKTTVNVENFPDNAGINDVSIKLTTGPSNTELISQTHLNGQFNLPIQNSLVGKKLLDGDLNFDLTVDWMRPGDTQVVTITGTPTITVLFDLKLTNPDSVTINVSDAISLVDSDVLTLPKFSDNTSDMGGCGVTSLFGGTIVPDTEKAFNASNKFIFKDVTSTFPFPVQLQIHFKNFFPETGSTDSVKIDEEVFGDNWVDIVKTIANHEFKHSSGNDTIPIDEFDVDFDMKTKGGTYGFLIDGSQPTWQFDFAMNVGKMEFKTLKAKIDCPFPEVKQEMPAMGSGLPGMSFEGIQMDFEFINQIRAPVEMNFNLKGTSPLGEIVEVPLDYVSIATPINLGDSAKTIVRMNATGYSVLEYNPWSGPSTPITNETNYLKSSDSTIVKLLSSGPQSINVNASAGITDKTAASLDLGSKIKGTFKLIAPFEIKMEEIAWLPEKATVIDEWEHDTRAKLRNFVKESVLTTRVINGLPIGGELAILFSDNTIFPYGRSELALTSLKDDFVKNQEVGKNKWSDSDTISILTKCSDLLSQSVYLSNVIYDMKNCSENSGYIVQRKIGAKDTLIAYVDTLFKLILPRPNSWENIPPNSVDISADSTTVSILDTSKMNLLTDIGSHYVKPRILFKGSINKVPDVISFSMRDTLKIQSYIGFLLQSDGFTTKSKDEFILKYPNGGETLQNFQSVDVKWIALGDSIPDQKINLFKSNNSFPDINDESIWNQINLIGSPNGKDSTANWTPSSVQDTVWLKICNEDNTICDMTMTWFKVE